MNWKLTLSIIIIINNIQKTIQFSIDDLAFTYVEDVPDYGQFVSKISELKAGLYRNYTFDNDTGEFPPPRGSVVQRNKRLGYIEMVTEVNVWIHASRVVKVDIEQQSLTIIVFEVFFWRDKALRWDRDIDSVPVEEISLDASKVWTPGIFPVNFLDILDIMGPHKVEVDHDGLCTLRKTVQYTIPCSVKIENFPFDEQNCSLTFSQDGNIHSRIKMKPFSLELLQDARNGDEDLFYDDRFAHLEWDILSSKSQSLIDGYELVFSVLLKRQSTFYATVLIFPVILLNILSLVVFTLPINTTERENFSLTLILTYFVSVMIIVQESPPTGNQTPYLGLYVLLCTAVVVLTFAMSLILIEINEHCREKHRKMPRFLTMFLEQFCALEKTYKAYYESKEQNGNILLTSKLISSENQKSITEEDGLNMKEDEKRKESFKWKLLCKILNIIFFCITLAIHVILACMVFIVL